MPLVDLYDRPPCLCYRCLAGLFLAFRCCGAVAVLAALATKACTLCLPVVLPKLDCFAAPLLPSLALPEYERSGKVELSGCHADVVTSVPLATRSFCRLFLPDAVSPSRS